MEALARVKISNHPILTNVERYVSVTGFSKLSTKTKHLIFEYHIEYFKDGVDITHNFNQKLPIWHIDNNRVVFVRDAEGNKIVNEDYEPNYPIIDFLNETRSETPDNEDDQWVRMLAFDYFTSLVLGEANVNIQTLLATYIVLDDIEHKRFNL